MYGLRRAHNILPLVQANSGCGRSELGVVQGPAERSPLGRRQIVQSRYTCRYQHSSTFSMTAFAVSSLDELITHQVDQALCDSAESWMLMTHRLRWDLLVMPQPE